MTVEDWGNGIVWSNEEAVEDDDEKFRVVKNLDKRAKLSRSLY